MWSKRFYSIWGAEDEEEEGGVRWWFWMVVFLSLEILLIRWIVEMQREKARRARAVDQARRAKAEEEEAPIQVAPEPIPEAEEETAAIKPTKPALLEIEDFRKIEGIGPKVNNLLHEAGIRTYAELAASSEEQLRVILREANLYMINPRMWPEQADLAAKGDWEGLQALKERLKGGREE